MHRQYGVRSYEVYSIEIAQFRDKAHKEIKVRLSVRGVAFFFAVRHMRCFPIGGMILQQDISLDTIRTTLEIIISLAYC